MKETIYNPAQLADLAELNQLAYRYAKAVDNPDVNGFLDVFHPDARLTVYSAGAVEPRTVVEGHEQLANIPRSMRQRFARTAHLMTNHIIDLDGDTATGNLLCTARHLYTNAVGGTDYVVVIRYVDRYERRDGRWRILDREIRFQWSETHSTLRDETVMT